MTGMQRRDFLRMTAAAPLAAAAAPQRPSLVLFSKHLPRLNYDELGRTVKQLGFDGVDLTVRPEGHVLPARAAEDLPRAAEAIRGHGLTLPMITTGLLSENDPAARPTLATAAKLGVPFYKLGYWRYRGGVEKTVAEVRRSVEGLVAVGKEWGIAAGFHNHSGDYVGSPVWDIRSIVDGMDPRWIGYYFDPCHATAEGGSAGWRLAFEIAAPRLKMVAVKDFYWEKTGGRWRMKMCPLGEGMVDWAAFFKMLAAASFTGPISLHVEYDPKDELDAMSRDLAFLRKSLA
jgi:sugar phosphate isomerase/epimerase